MVSTDSPHGMSNRSCHTGSGALRDRTHASVAPSEPDRAGQLARKEVQFGRCLGNPRCVPQCSRLFQIVRDFGEPPAVHVLRTGIEHHTRIAFVPS